MESPLALTAAPSRTEAGQSVALFAILIPVTVLFALGIFDYMLTNAALMRAVAAADLAAHAGAQSVHVHPDGELEILNGPAETTAATVFQLQRPRGAVLQSVSCGMVQEKPSCTIRAAVRSAGILIPGRWIEYTATGYLAYGVTRQDQ